MEANAQMVRQGLQQALGQIDRHLEDYAEDIAAQINAKAETIDGGAFKFPISCGISFAMGQDGKLSVEGRASFGLKIHVRTESQILDDHPDLFEAAAKAESEDTAENEGGEG